MNIPSHLLNQISEGNVVLLLGSGASWDAVNPKGEHPPIGKGLGHLLADKFLGGSYRDSSLSQISEYSISESDLRTVQQYIHDLFEPFETTDSHRKLASFKWWGIATTNYDRLIEKGYQQNANATQLPVTFIENGDRVTDRLRSKNSIMLLKLHGCITRINNRDCPLILTPDQYVQYRKGRSRIFDHLKDWAYEKSIVFIGHSLDDPDIRALLLELDEIANDRPRFYAVAPDVDDIKQRFWNEKRVTLIKATFTQFIDELDQKIDANLRKISIPTPGGSHPIYRKFVKKTTLSSQCCQFIEADAYYLSNSLTTTKISPQDFYHGHNPEWSAIEQKLDAERDLTDSILADHFIEMKDTEADRPQLVVIKAHAGAGKTVLLRRLAWDSANEFDCMCLYIKQNGIIDSASVQEMIGLTNERLFLFIDDIADHEDEILSLMRTVGPEGKRLTIIGAERINEWFPCERLNDFVTDDYILGYLSENEISRLLNLLEKHKSLGTLGLKSEEERRKEFVERAGRQLLVALHEATLGQPFENIVENEYLSIRPDRARNVYLTICILNRLHVSVRAGIISRIHGISFKQFQKEFFQPLERVVFTRFDHTFRDYVYEARHPHIAQIVFEKVLIDPEERFDAYIKCLDALNIDYKPDRLAFGEMVRGRHILKLFPSHEMVQLLYKKAREKVGDAPFLLQQMAIYEMHGPGGNLNMARDYLKQALKQSPKNPVFLHSLAELYLGLSGRARTDREKGLYLDEASLIARDLKSISRRSSHSQHIIIKIALQRLNDVIDNYEKHTDNELEVLIKDAERAVKDALQAHPGDSYILESESKLAQMLKDSDRCLIAMEKAFASNPRSPYLAVRLAKQYEKSDPKKAKETLFNALDVNRGETRLHYEYAKLLRENNLGDKEEILYHLHRSYTSGDRNYDARLLYASELFVANKTQDAKNIFRELTNARVGPSIRNRLNYPMNQVFSGSVVRRESTYCFIEQDGSNDWIHLYYMRAEKLWAGLSTSSRVQFKIGFTFKGPSAFDVVMESA